MSNTDLLNKTWTLSDSEENLSEEIFSDHSPAHKTFNKNNITQTVESTSPEFLLKNLSYTKSQPTTTSSSQKNNRIDVSMRSSFTSFNLSPRSTTFVKEEQYVLSSDYRSLNIDWQRHSTDIENIFEKICHLEFTSLFDESTSGLDFE